MTNISTPGTEKYNGLSNTWRFRFEFFDRNGTPGAIKTSPVYTAAFRELSFGLFIASRVNTYNYERRALGRHTWGL
jgi:hypothetical protein